MLTSAAAISQSRLPWESLVLSCSPFTPLPLFPTSHAHLFVHFEAGVVGPVLPVLKTKALHVNRLWGGQSRPCIDIQEPSLSDKNQQSNVSCLLTEDKTIIRDQAWVKRQTRTLRKKDEGRKKGVWMRDKWKIRACGGGLNMYRLDNSLCVSLTSWGWVTGWVLPCIELHNSNWRHFWRGRKERTLFSAP